MFFAERAKRKSVIRIKPILNASYGRVKPKTERS